MATQEIEALIETVPFENVEQAPAGGFTVLHWIGAIGNGIPAYWSTARDQKLRQFYLRSDYLKIAVKTFTEKACSVPLRIRPRDRSVKAHAALAEQIEADILRNSGLLKGFYVEFAKFVRAYLTQDNGAFMLVMGGGEADGPIEGAVTGLLHLDSSRCTRTGDVEFPVVYIHTDGKRYRLHYTRVIFMSNMPSDDADLLDVGLCAVSSCIDAAQEMIDIATFHAEKLGSRPARQILYAKKGISFAQFEKAVILGNTKLDAQGLERFARTLLLAPAQGQEMELATVDLSSVPDGFDRQQATMLDVAVIATAFGLDTRDLSHAFGVAGTTKADAEVQHQKTGSKGVAQFLNDFSYQLDAKVLPPTLESLFDYVDDSQDEQAALIRKTRAEGRNLDLGNMSITVRVAREQMLEAGEITDEQFEQMELAEGRLPDGLDVLMLFSSQDSEIRRILNFGVDNILDTAANTITQQQIDERVQMAWQRHDAAPTAAGKRKMRQALAALEKLRPMYSGSAAQPEPEPEEEPADEQPFNVADETSVEGEPVQRGRFLTEDDLRRAKKKDEVKAYHTKQDEDLDELMEEYGDELDSLVSAANSGEMSQSDFNKEMEAVVAALLLAAFLRGSRLSEGELTRRLRATVGEETDISLDAVRGLSDDIYSGRYSPEQLGEEGAGRRLELWVGALGRMYAMGQVNRQDNPKFTWRTGATEHCETCAMLSGQTRTAKEWLESGYYPRSSSLACGGFRCQCYFQEA